MHKRRDEEGIYIVLFAVLSVALMSLAALVLGVTYLTAGRARLEQIADLVSLSAIEVYSRSPDPDESHKRAAAVSRAQAILKENKIRGTLSTLGDLNSSNPSNSSGAIEFGQYFYENPGGGRNPCSGSYPCFVSDPSRFLPNNTASPTAVRVQVYNQSNNKILGPLNHLLGVDTGASASAEGIATIAQRCTAFVMDISTSTVSESHPTGFRVGAPPSGSTGTPTMYLTTPPQPGLFAMSASNVLTADVDNPGFDPNTFRPFSASTAGDFFDCSSTVSNYSNQERLFWCNSGEMNNDGAGTNFITIRPPLSDLVNFSADFRDKIRFKSDYRLHPSFSGDNPINRYLLIDAKTDPQPYTRFMLAFNAAFQELIRYRSNRDLAVLIAFNNVIRDIYPSRGQGGVARLQNDLNPFLQITNLDLRGKLVSDGTSWVTANPLNRVSPNAIDRGWVPLGDSTDGTNLIRALVEAINALSSDNCPDVARKAIILATDGIGNCMADFQAVGNRIVVSNEQCAIPPTSPSGFPALDRFHAQGGRLLNELLAILKDRNIALTVMMDGSYIGPNFFNRTDQSGRLINPEDLGFLKPKDGNWYDYVYGQTQCDGAPCCNVNPEGCALDNLGKPGMIFRKPLTFMAQLAGESKGIFCPLMPICDDAAITQMFSDYYGESPPGKPAGCVKFPAPNGTYYEDADGNPGTPRTLRKECRPTGDVWWKWSRQTCSIYELTKAEQAIKCALDTIGRNPFSLATIH